MKMKWDLDSIMQKDVVLEDPEVFQRIMGSEEPSQWADDSEDEYPEDEEDPFGTGKERSEEEIEQGILAEQAMRKAASLAFQAANKQKNIDAMRQSDDADQGAQGQGDPMRGGGY